MSGGDIGAGEAPRRYFLGATREPALRAGVVTVGAVLLAEALLHAGYGDLAHAGCFAVAVGAIAAFGTFGARMRARPAWAKWAGSLLATAVGSVAVARAYPPGPVYFGLMIPQALLIAALAARVRVALAIVAGVWALPLVLTGVGLPPPPPPATPDTLAAATAALGGVALAYALARQVAERNAADLADIARAEAVLAREGERLAGQRADLEAAAGRLARHNDELAAQVARERDLTRELVAHHGDQEGLVQAIHQDLREPLRGIVSFTQLIGRTLAAHGEGAAAVAEYIAFAEDGGRRMDAMLADLLRYARDEPEEAVAVDLAALAHGVRDDLADALARHGAALELGDLPAVLGYPTQLRQLVQNLVANAIKFHRPGVAPRVSLAASVGASGATLEVRDNGIGIPPERLGEVFGLFNRVHVGGERDFEGSGVGLALCRRIALAHGAELTVDSREGEGTTFRLAGLPLAGAGAPRAAEAAPAPRISPEYSAS